MPASGDRRWGWHRFDPRWAERLVAESGVGPGDLVVDLGAGEGAITEPLVGAGARVIAVELHGTRAAALRARFAGAAVTVVRADLADLRLPRRPFSVVANPPFAATTAIVRRLTAPGSRLLSAHLVVPRTTAHRWLSSSAPGVGRWGRTYEVRTGSRVPRRAFAPRPPVDCTTLVIVRR